MYPFLELQDWELLYQLPFIVSAEPYLQSFQYKILNRILNTKENLHKWKISEKNKCDYCNITDTIEHHLFTCNHCKQFWNNLETWLHCNLEINFKLVECEIIFGIPSNNSVDINIMNYIILLGKWYIHKARSSGNQLYVFEFLKILRGKIECVIQATVAKDLKPKEWQEELLSIL